MRLHLFVTVVTIIMLVSERAESLSYHDVRGRPYSVGLTPRGLTINGQPQLLLSGDIHYARAFPPEQELGLDKLRADSLNAVQTYAFWSLHEPEQGVMCWGQADASSSERCRAAGERANITRFLQAAAARDLWVILRIGPFICGEWSYGGIPSWINGKPDVQIRAHNPSWETSMTAFVRAIWQKIEPFTAARGGPVLMLQLENENGRAIPGDPYTEYVASLARSLNSSLPFLWCEGGQDEIVPFNPINTTGKPSPFVPAINGNDGSAYAEAQTKASPEYPLFWTENEGWYHPWGSAPIDGGAGALALDESDHPSVGSSILENPNRKPEDVATSVARWVARGGAYMNYYMYYGGQHFMASAAAGVLNSYADGVNLHSDGMSNQPKRSHLAHLHTTLLAHAETIMATTRPIPAHSLGSDGLSAYVFGDGDLVFLENANGNPGYGSHHSTVVDESSSDVAQAAYSDRHHSFITTTSPSGLGNCSFPIDTSTVRYKGLKAAPPTITSEQECASVCCAAGSATRCNMYQFYETKTKGQISQCWIGTPSYAKGSPPHGFRSRARVKPSPGPAPPGPFPARQATVQWNGSSYVLPAYSVTIVDRSGAVLFQTHNVSAVEATQRVFRPATSLPLEWVCWSELSLIAARSIAAEAVRSAVPLEQLNLTRDRTEYLLYVTTVPKTSSNKAGKSLRLAGRIANAYSAFVDGKLVGQAWNAAHAYGNKTYQVTLAQNITYSSGDEFLPASAGSSASQLAILSTSLGMHSHVTSRALDFKGIVGSVSLDGMELSSWSHLIGLAGEKWNAGGGNQSLDWSICSNQSGPLTWRKTSFSLPSRVLDDETISVMLDVSGLSRGHYYLNGFDLGKYWTIGPNGLGPTQRYYQLPRSLLRPDTHENLLVLADELGTLAPGSARGVRVVLSSMEPVWQQ